MEKDLKLHDMIAMGNTHGGETDVPFTCFLECAMPQIMKQKLRMKYLR